MQNPRTVFSMMFHQREWTRSSAGYNYSRWESSEAAMLMIQSGAFEALQVVKDSNFRIMIISSSVVVFDSGWVPRSDKRALFVADSAVRLVIGASIVEAAIDLQAKEFFTLEASLS